MADELQTAVETFSKKMDTARYAEGVEKLVPRYNEYLD